MHTPLRRSRRHTAALTAALLAIGGSTVLTACGGSDNEKSAAGDIKSQVNDLKPGKKGGTLTLLSNGDVDYIDPGETYYQFGYQVAYSTNRPLYNYAPNESLKASPDLADGEPQVSSDQKTITVKIKSGIKYSPPLQDRTVTSKDVKYAIERAFSKNVPNAYARLYFGEIVGAPTGQPGDIKPISGIETPDDQTIVFKLKKPVAGLVVGALVMPVTIPVPEEYASKFDKKIPSTYDQHVVFTGPYQVQADSSGKLIGRKPGKQITLVRNPSWDAKTDTRPAYLDKVVISEGNTDDIIAGRRSLKGTSLACCGDSTSPPAQILKLASTQYPQQISRTSSGGGHWIALNTTVKPLDNINIRKAISASVDRFALQKIAGGKIIGPIASGYIPPGLPGFEEAGGLKQGSGNDFLASESGDAAVAKKYMLAAKADGLPVSADGKYTGKEKITMITANSPDQEKSAQVIEANLEKIGLNIDYKPVPQDTVYTKFCGVPKSKTAICPSVGWVKDFQDAETLFDATFDGKAIIPQGNTNWSQLDDPAVNAAMEKARTEPAGSSRNKAWAEVNKLITEQAPAVPLFWDDNILVTSPNVQNVTSLFLGTMDFSFTSLK